MEHVLFCVLFVGLEISADSINQNILFLDYAIFLTHVLGIANQFNTIRHICTSGTARLHLLKLMGISIINTLLLGLLYLGMRVFSLNLTTWF